MVLAGAGPAAQRDQPLVGVGLDVYVTADAPQALDENTEHLGLYVVGARLDHCGEVAQAIGFDGVGQGVETGQALGVVGDEKVVVVEEEMSMRDRAASPPSRRPRGQIVQSVALCPAESARANRDADSSALSFGGNRVAMERPRPQAAPDQRSGRT